MTKKKNYKSQKKNFTEKKKESPSPKNFFPKKSFFSKMNLSDGQVSVFTRTTFFLFSFWFLGIYNAELLYKLQGCSLFLYNLEFAGDTLSQSAGFLVYLSRFLTQFLYYPLLGALFLSLGLSIIEWWISRLFKISSRYFYLSFIPPALILSAQTSIGYELYHRFEASVVFSLVLGPLFTLLLFTFCRKIRNLRWGIWITLSVFFPFFLLTGIYAFIAWMMLAIEQIGYKEKYARWLFLEALLIGIFLPFVSGKYIFYETYLLGLIAPLPNPFFKDIFIISLLSLLFFLLYPVRRKRNKQLITIPGNPFFCCVMISLSLFAVFHFSFRDGNFRLELKLQHLTEKYAWDEVIKEAEKAEEPTKAIAAYRVIALGYTNQLSQRLFDFNYHFKPSASVYMDGFQRLFYYSELYFHASFPNAAYLWNMEFWAGMKANVYLLKQMALCAMLNGEKELASKYFNLLKQSLFYKTWAEEQERYNNDPDRLLENPVYKQIKHYMPEENFVLPVNYSLPVYYTCLEKSFLKNRERSILAGMYIRDLNRFMWYMQAVDGNDELPACMQEALLLYAMLNNNFAVLERFRIDEKWKEKVTSCLNEYKKYGNNPKLAEEKLKKNYKGTYCYFYLFKKTE